MKLEAEKKTPLTVQIESELMKKVKAKAKKQKLSIRKVIEYYFHAFVAGEK